MRNASDPARSLHVTDAGRPPEEDDRAPAAALSGTDFQRMLQAAAAWLDQHADAIDAINVFPVPDGDTGRNMAQTLRAAQRAAGALPDGTPLDTITRAAADGALLGARGNSGVILSQWLRGLAAAVEGETGADTALLASALSRASESAYAAIEAPREGTILSVARAAADCGPSPHGAPLLSALGDAVLRAEAAVARTPQQMPLLAEAGVVDSGAQGLAVVLAGLHQGLAGALTSPPAADFGHIRPSWLNGAWLSGAQAEAPGGAAHIHGSYGFCTEFVLSGPALDLETVRRALDGLGDSLIVAGDAQLVRVHVHTDNPEAAFDAGRRFGAIDRCSTDDMDARHADLTRRAAASAPVSAVAVTSGAGFARLFRELGAEIAEGGPTRNPSAAEILAAARRSGGRDVLILPNDPNVIAAARQAAALAEDGAEDGAQDGADTASDAGARDAGARDAGARDAGARDGGAGDGAGRIRLHVVPTQSQPAAVAALSAWDHAATVAEAQSRMREAAEALLAGAVTHAARAIERPIALRAGQPFAMLGREIVAGAETAEDALLALVEQALRGWEALDRGPAELLSVYTGDDITSTEELEEGLRTALRHHGAPVEVEVVIGGQPHYPFILSLE